MNKLAGLKLAVGEANTIEMYGKVTQVIGSLVEGYLPGAKIGDACDILPDKDRSSIKAEVVGFKENHTLLMALKDLKGIGAGSEIRLNKGVEHIILGNSILGRVLNAFGEPIDFKGPIVESDRTSLFKDPINPLKRKPIKECMDVGIRVVNGLITLGKGQRVTIFSGSGIGKSIMLGMMAKYTKADVTVIGLIGERGREVSEFIENNLRKEGLKRSVVVVATSDETPLLRVRAAFMANAIAEYFCNKGLDVLLLMDSLTRFAMAQREIGLSIGEPPTTRGYTPSVFSLLPKLMERAGNFDGKGSITGVYSVLVDGDDMAFDGVSDAIRAVSDGHIILSRELAFQSIYPAIDVLASLSRVMTEVVDKGHMDTANKFRDTLSNFKKAEDLINIGAYVKGSNPKIDFSISKFDSIVNYIRQDKNERVDFGKSISQLSGLFR